MSPIQHGEVFVTEDGAETDWTRGTTSVYSYQNEPPQQLHHGSYLLLTFCVKNAAVTISAQPYRLFRITNAIKERVLEGGEGHDVVLVEIGGTVGDIESLPFLEAIRQMAVEIGREHTLFMHLTLVPYMAASGEVKQTDSALCKRLLSIGIQPDILICRSDRAVPANERAKIALFCNVPEKRLFL